MRPRWTSPQQASVVSGFHPTQALPARQGRALGRKARICFHNGNNRPWRKTVRTSNRVQVMPMAGGAGERLQFLTRGRSKGAVPFGGKFRLVDVTLSNCINSGLRRIFVLTQYLSESLNRHIQEGWAISSAGLGDYIYCIPAQQKLGTAWYLGTADAVRQNLDLGRVCKIGPLWDSGADCSYPALPTHDGELPLWRDVISFRASRPAWARGRTSQNVRGRRKASPARCARLGRSRPERRGHGICPRPGASDKCQRHPGSWRVSPPSCTSRPPTRPSTPRRRVCGFSSVPDTRGATAA